MFALVVAYLKNSPVEITRQVQLAQMKRMEEAQSSPYYAQSKAAWDAAVKVAEDKSV